MKKIAPISFLVAILMTSGCSIFQSTPQQELHISWKEPNKFYFQGKGAGAGMALMGTMGAMGMAIGVAIDEGISKDITKAQNKSGKSIENLLDEAAENSAYKLSFNRPNNTNNANLIIKRIEFKIIRGKNDATAVNIQALYRDQTGNEHHLNYPDDIPNFEAPSFPLEQLKSEKKLANQLLNTGFKHLFTSILKLSNSRTKHPKD